MDLFYRWLSEKAGDIRYALWEWFRSYYVLQQAEDSNNSSAPIDTTGAGPPLAAPTPVTPARSSSHTCTATPRVPPASVAVETDSKHLKVTDLEKVLAKYPVETKPENKITKTAPISGKKFEQGNDSYKDGRSQTEEATRMKQGNRFEIAIADVAPMGAEAESTKMTVGRIAAGSPARVSETQLLEESSGDLEETHANDNTPGTSAIGQRRTKSLEETASMRIARISSGSASRERVARRTRVPDRPRVSYSLWSMLKNFIGQDLSKIPLSVHFFEPLSMLQRIAEDFESADLLDQAAACKDRLERLAYVAAFTVASYSSTDKRTLKPFNPLLGETFEFDRTADLGWRLIAEQVSHHPAISALYCEGKGWKFNHVWDGSTKLYANSIVFTPRGGLSVEFHNDGHKYKWKKLNTTARNIVIGTVYLEHIGEMTIADETAGEKCYIRYTGYSSFAKSDFRKIQGEVVDKNNMVKWLISGFWDQNVQIAQVTKDIRWERDKTHALLTNLSKRTIWTRFPVQPGSEKYYNLSIFACQLNQEETGVAPTDSRLRPDQRLMETGNWDEANEVKKRLEDKQRQKAKGKGNNTNPIPVWFNMRQLNGEVVYEYGNEYWDCKRKQNWSRCPDIF